MRRSTETGQPHEVLASNVERLQALFPEAVREGQVDFDVLKQLLGGAVDERTERYGLGWHGKRQARQEALLPATCSLIPCLEDSLDAETTRNMVIEGDNLEVLKLLQDSHAASAKVVYLDPPYNTGKDFVYPDNFQDSRRDYLERTGQGRDAQRGAETPETRGRFHTAWLTMMFPRLMLARELLRDDGVLLVSLNDIEAPALRLVLDEIFGEENFLCQFVWNTTGNVDQQSKIKGVHEYVIAYARNLDALPHPRVIDPNIAEHSKLYNDRIENSITKNGPANPPSEILLPAGFPASFEAGVIPARADRWPQLLDEIHVEGGKLTRPARVRSGWSSRNLLELFIRNGGIPIEDGAGKQTWFEMTATGAIYGYKARSESQGHVLSVIRNVGTTKQNRSMLASWGLAFSYPKPLLLLEYLIEVFTRPGEDALIVDLFAGSGTTGHAVYRLNARDGGDRRFVLVQLPEALESAASSGARTIADLTMTRLRLSARKVREDHPAFSGDLGFRAFRASGVRATPPAHPDPS